MATKKQEQPAPLNELAMALLTPVKVGLIKFNGHGQDGPGMSLKEALRTDRPEATHTPWDSRHTVHYLPWLNAFRVEYRDGDRYDMAHIPAANVHFWTPAEG